jgi:hypothetical protein
MWFSSCVSSQHHNPCYTVHDVTKQIPCLYDGRDQVQDGAGSGTVELVIWGWYRILVRGAITPATKFQTLDAFCRASIQVPSTRTRSHGFARLDIGALPRRLACVPAYVALGLRCQLANNNELTRRSYCGHGTAALFCKSYFNLFQLVSAYSLSQNTIESVETSRLFHQPNQPLVWMWSTAECMPSLMQEYESVLVSKNF